MNIQDIKVDYSEYKDRDLIDVIFEKQDELRKLYKVPICDLDVPSDQQQLRSMAWNVVEEAAEAIDVVMTSEHRDHIFDELADMISFYLELLIMCSLTPKDFILEKWNSDSTSSYQLNEISMTFMSFTSGLAIAINSLKNRYWRQTNLKTEKELFETRLKKTVPLFRDFVKSLNVSFDELIDAYLRKHQVNLFRIRSKY